ncbi:MAG: hypothetical protein HLX51_09425 [Micrococcaceae bacterium]|nr:hypothetical protein [Micrococcaceae bacterium]
MLALRSRVVPLLGVFLGAPVTAEYLQAYLSFTGDPWASVGGVIFFAPLYGGAALLIREIAVRTGRGWSGVLLLAAAFGVAMPGVIDLAMFGAERADVSYWAELREPTLIEPLGISAAATLSWTIGHVMMSIGAPLALLHALAPAHRNRPLLGKVGMPLTGMAFAAVAIVVHQDGQETYGYSLSVGQVVAVLAVVGVLAGTAFTGLGAPLQAKQAGEGVPAALVVIFAAVLKVAIDLLPPTWIGLASTMAILVAAGALVHHAAVHHRWGAREIGLLGAGVVIGGILIGFASPVPEGVSAAAKIAQSSTLLALALLVLTLVLRRTPDSARHS